MLFTGAAIVLSEATSNTAAANMIVPVAIAVAQAAGVSPLEPALGATLGASMGFMMPVSTPPNAIVYSSGFIPITSMMRYGILLDVCRLLRDRRAGAAARPAGLLNHEAHEGHGTRTHSDLRCSARCFVVQILRTRPINVVARFAHAIAVSSRVMTCEIRCFRACTSACAAAKSCACIGCARFLHVAVDGGERLPGVGDDAAGTRGPFGRRERPFAWAISAVISAMDAFHFAAEAAMCLGRQAGRVLRVLAAFERVVERQAIVALGDGIVGELQRGDGGVELLRREAIGAGGSRGIDRPLRLVHFLVWGVPHAVSSSEREHPCSQRTNHA